jgi:hypothetical protein
VIGLFQGAHYHPTAWYRPKFDCLMNHPSGGLPFCEICREALVLSFYRKVRPVDTFAPAGTNVLVSSWQPVVFTLFSPQPATHSFGIQWSLDGNSVPGATNASFIFLPQNEPNGSHTLTTVVRDPTPFVRNDPTSLLSQSITWRLTLSLPHLQIDSSLLTASNCFVFRVSGNAPQGFALQTTTNLESWTSVSTNILVSGQFYCTNLVTGAKSFFRALAL